MRSYLDIYVANLFFNLPILAVLVVLALTTPLGYGLPVGWFIGSLIGTWISYRIEKNRYQRMNNEV